MELEKLINLLLVKVRNYYDIILAAASSDIVATLLDGEKTINLLLEMPLNINSIKTPTSNINKQSNMEKMLKECKLIIWNKNSLLQKKRLKTLNNCLKRFEKFKFNNGRTNWRFSGNTTAYT